MKKLLLTVILAAGILPLRAGEQAGQITWGSELETPYLSWNWIKIGHIDFPDAGERMLSGMPATQPP